MLKAAGTSTSTPSRDGEGRSGGPALETAPIMAYVWEDEQGPSERRNCYKGVNERRCGVAGMNVPARRGPCHGTAEPLTSTPRGRNAEEAVRIEVPMLTPREMRHLDRSLPCADLNDMDLESIPERDARHYAKLYRYLPNFVSFEP